VLRVPHLSIHAAGRGDPGPRRAFGDLAFLIRHSGCGPATSGSGLLLVLGLALCSAAVEGGGSIVRSSGNLPGGGDMPSRGSSKCRVADRGGPV